MTRFLQRLKAFRRQQDGSSTVEFVIIFPAVIALVFGVIESGWLMTRYMMLDRGLDITVREVRLGLMDPVSHDKIRNSICLHSKILPACETTLVVELVPLGEFNPQANCFPRNEETPNPVLNVDPSKNLRSEIMFIRACSNVDPMLPGLEFGLLLPKDTATGAHQMISYSAFMNEPI
ncbi:MAG: TadE family protein [Pseudomonadota bacterium]